MLTRAFDLPLSVGFVDESVMVGLLACWANTQTSNVNDHIHIKGWLVCVNLHVGVRDGLDLSALRMLPNPKRLAVSVSVAHTLMNKLAE